MSALVHHSALSTVERARHGSFIAQTFAITFATLAVAPFFLAFHGAPTLAQSLVFVFGLSHLAAAMIVARTGRLSAGHLICFASLVGASLTLFMGVGAGVGCALAWLMVAQVEAAQINEKRLSRLCTIVTLSCLAALVTASIEGDMAAATLAPVSVAALTAFAMVQALFPVHRFVMIADLMGTSEREQGDRWHAISEALGDAILEFGADGTVHQVSSEGEALIGASAADLYGRGLFDHIHVADRPAFLKLIADAAHGDKAPSATVRLRSWAVVADYRGFHEPYHLWIEVRARKLDHRAGHADSMGETRSHVVAVLRDVTALRERDLEVEAARQSIDTAMRSKDHFLANMSHELRTPLNAIIGFSEMLASHTLRPQDTDKQRDYARIINQSGQHLLSVVNSILDMSKIQSGTFSIIPEPFEIAPLLDLCCDMVKLKAGEGSIRIVRDYPTELEPVVGDKRACKQIMINLLSNAVKFTPCNGQVVMKARPEGNTLVLTVSDSGIGIAAADLPRLGDPFFQARSTLSRPYEGTGLGLSVVRGLIGLHGGTIAIESELGIGTSVTIRLPLDCRAIRAKGSSATIETIARRQPTEFHRFPKPRMKHIA